MLLSIALILLFGLFFGELFDRLRLPRLLGMLLCGILLGPAVLGWLDDSILNISAPLRKIALMLILLKAGLGLDGKSLKKAGRGAICLSFMPACFEIAAYILFAPILLGIPRIQAAVLGCVIAAVSPAVLVPKMSQLMEGKWGTDQSIPQMLLAGSSVDDVVVIVLFSVFSAMAVGDGFSPEMLLRIPTSIMLGGLLGAAGGLFFGLLFQRIHLRDSAKMVALCGIALLFTVVEDKMTGKIGVSGLLAVMCMGIVLRMRIPEACVRLSRKFSKLWVAAEIFLFVLVGASVELSYLKYAGLGVLGMLFIGLTIRCVGVWLSVVGTKLNRKERIFVLLAEIPKATVQAAIGGIPLSMGMTCGTQILTVAVISILICAPLGAILIERSYPRLLKKGKI